MSCIPPLVIYQMKISLVRISPMIWRRILVRSDMTLSGLHRVIQIAMGWGDYHLHAFRIHGWRFAIQWMGEHHRREGREVLLSDLGLRNRQKLLYTYDFGDCWKHAVRVEAQLDLETRKRYPVCSDGRRACPPEDCGGGRPDMTPWWAASIGISIPEFCTFG